MKNEIERMINQSKNKLHTALKVVITGNLIDFVGSHTFDEKILKERLFKPDKEKLAIDDSSDLIKSISKVKSLLYIGDNCGEILLDKIFISSLKKIYPDLKVFVGVRGEPIINDVTIKDAEMIKMEDVAEVISNGDGSPGIILNQVNHNFREVFTQADVIIAKRQGNFGSLIEIENIKYIFYVYGEM